MDAFPFIKSQVLFNFHTTELRATMNSLSWSLRATERPRLQEKTQVLLNVSIPVPSDSDTIRGRYLWRVGMYGAMKKNGKGDKFGYVRQTILDNQVR